MKHKTALLAGLLLVMALAAPGWARTVKIETAVPLSDHSPETLERAIKEALDTTVQGATAMGFSWIRLDMVATDDDSEDAPADDDLSVSDPLNPASGGF